MGMKEIITVNLENKVIEYCGKRLAILKQFDFEGKTYLYALDIDTFDKENQEYSFLYRVTDDIMNHVEDEELWERLFTAVGGIFAAEIAVENFKNMQKNN